MTFSHLITLANDSGGTLYLMVLLLTFAITVIIERSRYLSNMLEAGEDLIKLLKSKQCKNQDLINEFSLKHPYLPHLELTQVAIQFAGDEITRNDMDGALEEAVMHVVPRLDKSLWILDTIITLAPLLGLFGTIFGMFNAFNVMGDAQNATGQVTSGIAEALLATASGLTVAMIGLVFFNGLNMRIKLVIHQLETLKLILLNHTIKAIHGNAHTQSNPLRVIQG
jgi:biopolymer transport protein ExbB